MNKFFFSLLVLASLLSSALCSAGDIVVADAWVREAPPVSKVQAAYMQIQNKSNEDMSLISVSSPAFGRVEFHRTEMNNGMMRMLQEESLRIPSKGKIQLKPDATHMMLFNPKKSLRAGDTVPFILIFSDQQKLEITIKVKKDKGSTKNQHRCGHHN